MQPLEKDQQPRALVFHFSHWMDLSCSDENGDPESGGGGSATALVEKGPPTSVIVPIYRRDCHQGASP